MKKHTFIIILLLLVKSGWAQNTNLDYKIALKVYNLTSFEEYSKTRRPDDSASYYFNYTSSDLQILHPTVAIQWKAKKNNLHEIELTGFKLNKLGSKKDIKYDTTNSGPVVNENNLTITLISIRYEYILNFNKRKDKKLVPSLGFGFNPYYRQNKYSPKVSSLFPACEQYIGLRTFITPRLTYYLSPKFFIDINIPLCIFEIYYLIDKEEDPAIPVNSRTINTFNFSQFPKLFSGRLGVGFKL
jgi:hypothetical protein